MKLAFFVNTSMGPQILSSANSIERALKMSRQIQADGMILDMDAALKLLNQAVSDSRLARTAITAKTRQGIQRIPIENIFYFEADQKYVTVHHLNGALLIEETLKELEQEFPQQFIRIHRHLLANIAELDTLERDNEGVYWLKLRRHKKPLPVSRRRISLLRRSMKQ